MSGFDVILHVPIHANTRFHFIHSTYYYAIKAQFLQVSDKVIERLVAYVSVIHF